MSKPNDFGAYLRRLRKARGYNMAQLALYTDVSDSYISRIEAGKRGAPSPEVLQKMADVLSVSFEELMIAAGHWPEPNEAKTIAASSSEKEGPLTREEFESLVKAFKKLGIDIDI